MFIIYFDIFYNVCFCESMHVSRGALGGRTVHGILWITVRKPIWVLEMQPTSSRRAASTFKCWTISPVP